MKILGLDLSLRSTGVCLLSGDPPAEPTISTCLIEQPKTSGVQESIERLCAICKEVNRLVKEWRPDGVAIEAPAKAQVWQMSAIGELHGVVKMQLYLACEIVPVVEQATRMRKEVIGKIEGQFRSVEVKKLKGKNKGKLEVRRQLFYGNVIGKHGKERRATVKDMIESRLKEQGFLFPSQDEMDAYVAARYLWNQTATESR